MSEISLIEERIARNEGSEGNVKLLQAIAGGLGITGLFTGGLATIIGIILGGEASIADYINSLDIKKLKEKRDKIYKNNAWLKDTEKLEDDLTNSVQGTILAA